MIGLLVPYYDKNMPNKKALLERCLQSFAGLVDEIISIKDNSLSQYRKLNIGMNMTRQEYVIICNDDAFYKSGDLAELCVPKAMTRPLLNGVETSGWGHCFCLPTAIYKEIGGFDDGYEHGYYDDDDLQYTLAKFGYPIQLVRGVDISHPDMHGTTLSGIPGIDGVKERNRERFFSKWGKYPN